MTQRAEQTENSARLSLVHQSESASRAQRSISRAVPLVRQRNRFWPERDEMTLCWWLGAIDVSLVAWLAIIIGSR